jgi:uncharacterized membrane protein YeiB
VIDLTVAVRTIAFIAAGLYFGVAARVLWHYARHAPVTKLRRWHVAGVSFGTTLMVAGFVGVIYERIQQAWPLAWYGAPVIFFGVVSVVAALAALSYEQRKHNRRKATGGTNLGRRSVDRDPPAPTR